MSQQRRDIWIRNISLIELSHAAEIGANEAVQPRFCLGDMSGYLLDLPSPIFTLASLSLIVLSPFINQAASTPWQSFPRDSLCEVKLRYFVRH